MANRKVVDLPELTTLSNDDELYIVDISDLTESSEGTSKKIKASNFVPAGGESISNKQNSLTVDGTGVKYPTVDAVNAGLLLKENTDNKQNALTADGTGVKFPTLDAVNGGLASKADKQGTILYHSVRWFTPSSTVSNVGATVTSVGTQFTSGMVGSILRINNEDRLIITYTSSTVVVVESAYSTNYSGVLAGSWGVYSRSYISNAIVSGFAVINVFYSIIGAPVIYIDQNGNYVVNSSYALFQKLEPSSSLHLNNGVNFGLSSTSNIRWASTTNGEIGTKDIGLRRNSAGILEIYNGVTADGTLTNRRDLLVRKLLVNKSTDNGVDSLQVDGTISMSPATLSTQGVVKSQLSTQIEIGANSDVLEAWMDNEVIFTSSCTITVPATLPTNFNFNWLTLAGVTVTWAITTPHTWLFGTPGNATEKTYGRMVKRGSTNSIIML